jgi:hypothetical protein
VSLTLLFRHRQEGNCFIHCRHCIQKASGSSEKCLNITSLRTNILTKPNWGGFLYIEQPEYSDWNPLNVKSKSYSVLAVLPSNTITAGYHNITYKYQYVTRLKTCSVLHFIGVRRAQSVQRWTTGWTAWVWFPAVQVFSLLSIEPRSALGPPNVLSNGFQGHAADHLPQSSAKTKTGGATAPVPPYIFTAQ